MKRIYVFLLVFVLTSNAHAAEVLDLNTALQNTYRACADIDNNLHDLKVLAGVNTAVTAVGTGLGVGAAATGFVKARKDKQVEVKLDKLREIEQKNPGANSSDTEWQSFSESLQSELTTAKQEIEANFFAAQLLMPEQVRTIFNDDTLRPDDIIMSIIEGLCESREEVMETSPEGTRLRLRFTLKKSIS